MFKRSQFIRFGAAAALFVLVPALSLADGANAGHPASASSNTHARTITVSNRFVHPLANGCQYVSSLQGTMRELTAFELAQMGLAQHGQTVQPGHTGDAVVGSMLYRPNLQYSARVTCSNSSSQQSVSYTFAGVPMSWEHLQHVLQDGGRIVSYEGGPVCSYTPQFAFENGRVAATGIQQTCETPVARGGGPMLEHTPPSVLPSNPVVPSVNGFTGGGGDTIDPRDLGRTPDQSPRNQSTGLPR